MKGRKRKSILALVLALVMTLSVCGCGENGAGSTSGSQSGKDDNSASKQYVYSYETLDLGIDFENASVYGMSYLNDRIYLVVQDYSGQFNSAADIAGGSEGVTEEETVEEETAEDSADISSETVDEAETDGAADASMEAESGVEEAILDDDFAVTPEEYVYYGPVYLLVSAKLDGSDVQITVLDSGDQAQQSYLNRVKITEDGQIIAAVEEYFEDYSDPEKPIYKDLSYLVRWDSEGTLIWKKDMQEFVGEQDYYYPRDILVNKDGSVTFFSYEGIGATVDAEGNLVAPIELDSNMIMNMGNMFQKNDGTIYMTSYNDDYTKMYISTLDLATGTAGEKQELPGTLNNYTFNNGYNTDFILTNTLGVYTYNIGDEEPVQIMDFINSDFPSTYINGLVILDDEHMVGYYNDQTDWKLQIAYFTKVAPEDVPDKKTLVLGCNYIDYSIRNRVVEFNKTNPEYRITIKDYSTYATMDDYNAGYTQLNSDIISKQMPDILVVNSNMDTGNYISKGLFANLSELIAADEELSQVEFLENIMEAFSVDGVLYTMVPSFSINTLIGKTSILGDRQSWNMDDFMAFADSLPEDTKLFGDDMVRDSFIYQILRYLGNDFIDSQTGKCSFDSEEFIKLLEFTKTFPAEFSEDYWQNYDYTQYQSMYRENRAVLAECYMSSISDLKYQLKGMFGEEVTFIGFPTGEGNGSIISPSYRSFALSANSRYLEGGWEFIRYYLTDEYQSGDSLYEFPVSKTAFLKKAADATGKSYWIDENGEKVEYDDYYYMNGEEIVLDPFTQEEVDKICEFIYSVTKVSSFDDDIRTIITEEAQSFFEGQKTAQEVAQIIQSRAQIFVDENR